MKSKFICELLLAIFAVGLSICSKKKERLFQKRKQNLRALNWGTSQKFAIRLMMGPLFQGLLTGFVFPYKQRFTPPVNTFRPLCKKSGSKNFLTPGRCHLILLFQQNEEAITV